MPLNVEVHRDGKPVELNWDGQCLSFFLTTALKESDPELEYQDGKTFGSLTDGEWVDFGWNPIYYLNTKSPLWSVGELTLTGDHSYPRNKDGSEPVEFKAGDKFIMYRSYK